MRHARIVDRNDAAGWRRADDELVDELADPFVKCRSLEAIDGILRFFAHARRGLVETRLEGVELLCGLLEVGRRSGATEPLLPGRRTSAHEAGDND
jgi:hypothetical protein